MKKILLLFLALSMILGITSVGFASMSIAANGGDREFCCCHSTLYTFRIGGEDRIETAIEISKWMVDDGDLLGDSEVIICRADDYPDALAAASLAGYFGWPDCPILLNNSDTLDPRVEDELERLYGDFGDLDDEDDTVYLIGGEGALSSSIEDDLEDLGFGVERIGGDDRYETAANVADELMDLDGGDMEGLLICTGENWPDALAAAAFSAYAADDWNDEYPILLVKKDEIPGPTLDFLLANKGDGNGGFTTYVIGGPGVISSDVMADLGYYMDGDVERVAGDNRYETCVEIAEHPDLWDEPATDGPDDQEFIFATGDDFPDALAGARLAGDEGMPLLLTSSVNEAIEDYLEEYFEGATPHDPTGWADDDSGIGFVLGGEGAISKETEDDIAELLSDGQFDPTDEKPEIKDFTVTVNDVSNSGNLEDVAEWNYDDEIEFDVTTDKNIWNEDGLCGNVFIEDISELGGNEDPYDEPDYELDHTDGDDNEDNDFDGIVLVEKKHTSEDERGVTFTARAENQAGSDTDTSSSVDIYN